MGMLEMSNTLGSHFAARRRHRRGFTLLELLMVALIVTILASIAIAKFGDSKRRGYIAAMKSDLRNLATMAESKYVSDNSYAGLVAPGGSAGVSITVTSALTEWSASATHAAAPGITCTISSVSSGPNGPPMPDCN
jgi:prepilin-type N-terminal cleavage/methylation domain-containing protein